MKMKYLQGILLGALSLGIAKAATEADNIATNAFCLSKEYAYKSGAPYRKHLDFWPIDDENLLLRTFEEGNVTLEERFDLDFISQMTLTVAPFIAPGVALCLLTAVLLPLMFYLLRKYFRKKKGEEYTKSQKILPVVFFMIFAVTNMALSGFSIYEIHGYYQSTGSFICSLNNFSIGMHDFFSDISTPAETLKADVESLLDDGEEAINDIVVDLKAEHDLLVADLNELDQVLSNDLPTAITSSGNNILDDVRNDISNALTTLQTAADAIDTFETETAGSAESLTSHRESELDALYDFEELSANASEFSSSIKDLTTDLRIQTEKYYDTIVYISYISLGFVALSSIVGIVVIILNYTKYKLPHGASKATMILVYASAYIYSVLLFILSAVILPASYLFSMFCTVLHTIPEEIGTYVENFMGGDLPEEVNAAEAVESCFEESGTSSTRLIEEDSVSIDTTLFDSIPSDHGVTFDANLVGDVKTTLASISPSTFGVDRDSALADLVTETQSNGGATYTLADCTASDTCDATCLVDGTNPANTCAPEAGYTGDTSVLATLRTNLVNKIVSHEEITNLLNEANTKADSAVTQANAFINLADSSNLNTTEFTERINSLNDQINSIGVLGDCSFMVEAYWDTSYFLCEDSISYTTLAGLTFSVIGLLGIGVCITIIFIYHRVFRS